MINKALVRKILEHPFGFEWSLQGFGMLRLYLEPEIRLHVWDSRFTVESVSQTHTHPWNFHSTVVAGVVRNTRYHEVDSHKATGARTKALRRQTILCGVGGGLEGDPEDVELWAEPVEVYGAGHSYTQRAHEIHVSEPYDGTVTIIRREFLDDQDHAYVYFDGDWVSAEPRPASNLEVAQITEYALKRWFA